MTASGSACTAWTAASWATPRTPTRSRCSWRSTCARSYLYSLTPPATNYQSPYAAFLFGTHTGFCQHFAGAMAILLRFNGVPARVAVGFTTGRRVARSTFVVTRNDAHAWVEAYFPQIGWVSFDPTPGRSLPGVGASSTSAGFVDPFRHSGGTGGGPSSPAAAPVRDNAQKDPSTGESTGGAGVLVKGRSHWWLAWLALAAAVTAWPLARMGRPAAADAPRRRAPQAARVAGRALPHLARLWHARVRRADAGGDGAAAA